MNSIILEILRDGPPHNQLLSPLTKYMALCGEHAAVSLQLAFEHAQWLARMASLNYRDSEETRVLQLADVASAMGALLAQVPGMVAELTKCRQSISARPAARPSERTRSVQTVQLRLVLNANELAFLPLEMANAPSGFAAAGQPLALQTEVPLCITREIRRASTVDVTWTRTPKVLFAFANPGADVPYEQHLLALRAAVEPWVRLDYDADDEATRKAVMRQLFVLPRASVRALGELCAQHAFTHVHILAHGVPYRRGDDRRFGLALHDAINPHLADIVDGERLAAALRPHVHDRSQSLAMPAVVSLASCDSGNTGSVIGAGASIAHELHLKGIPLVVASQFPLTVQGSIIMVETLYQGLLWGQDPRCILDDMRRQLKALVPTSHDWGSIVAYSALPADIEGQCEQLAFRQARESIYAALQLADSTLKHFRSPFVGSSKLKVDPLLAIPFRKLDSARKKLKDLEASSVSSTESIYGLLAATEKRAAELIVTVTRTLQSRELLDDSERLEQRYDEARSRLGQSRKWYAREFANDRSEGWALVQELVLEVVLDPGFDPDELPAPDAVAEGRRAMREIHARWRDRWLLARLLAEQDLVSPDPSRCMWALGNLIELNLIALVWPAGVDRFPGDLPPSEGHRRKAAQFATRFAELKALHPSETRSTSRQIRRYVELFPVLSEARFGRLVDDARMLLQQLGSD